MQNVYLLLAYERPTGEPLLLARVDDSALVVQAANKAVQNAVSIAEELGAGDPVLTQVGHNQVSALKSTLHALIPNLTQPAFVN